MTISGACRQISQSGYIIMTSHARVKYEAEPHTSARKDIMLQLDQALVDSGEPKYQGSFRSCNLHGLAGIGKTQLAIQFALSREWHFNTVFWLNADDVAKLDDGFSRIAGALQIQDPSVENDHSIDRKVVLDWLSNSGRGTVANETRLAPASPKWLLIFDNVDDEEGIYDYWPTGGDGSILTISRRPMTRLESTVNVESLAWTLSDSTVFLQTLLLKASEPTLKGPHKVCGGNSWTSETVHRGRNDLETKVLVRALIMVAYAFRALYVEELIEALSTRLPTSTHCQGQEEDARWMGTMGDLKALCIDFLEIRDTGVVEFSHANTRNSLLAHSSTRMNLECGGDGHEMLAMVCIEHLQCLNPQILFKHIMPAARWLTGEKSECPLHSYTAEFWQYHSQIADMYSSDIPAMLHKAFMSALSLQARGALTTKEEINIGLWLCTFYGFKVLCRTYLEMGADPNSRTIWHEAPIHDGAARAGAEILLLLVERGADLTLQNGEGFTPLHLACAWGNIEATRVLIECGADINCQATPRASAFAGLCTPLCLAVLHGHVEIVRMLLSHPEIQLATLREDILTRVIENADLKMIETISDQMNTLNVADLGLRRQSSSTSIRENLSKQRDWRSLGCDFSEVGGSLRDESSNFVYSPLTVADSVCLIEVLPGQPKDDIRCRLNHVQLFICPRYEALSWAWGNSEVTKEISCNGNRLQVTANLEAALRSLRNIANSRTFWIDAICINQSHIEEKKCQASLLTQIFSQAEKMVVWLGEARYVSGLLCEALPEMDSFFIEGFQRYRASGEELRFNYKPPCTMLDTHLLKAAKDLFYGLWFIRLWIPQGLALASTSRVRCGSRDIPLEKITRLQWALSIVQQDFENLSMHHPKRSQICSDTHQLIMLVNERVDLNDIIICQKLKKSSVKCTTESNATGHDLDGQVMHQIQKAWGADGIFFVVNMRMRNSIIIFLCSRPESKLDRDLASNGIEEIFSEAKDLILLVEERMDEMRWDFAAVDSLDSLTKGLAPVAYELLGYELKGKEQNSSSLDRFSIDGSFVRDVKIAVRVSEEASKMKNHEKVTCYLFVAIDKNGHEETESVYLQKTAADSFPKVGRDLAQLWHAGKGDTNRFDLDSEMADTSENHGHRPVRMEGGSSYSIGQETGKQLPIHGKYDERMYLLFYVTKSQAKSPEPTAFGSTSKTNLPPLDLSRNQTPSST